MPVRIVAAFEHFVPRARQRDTMRLPGMSACHLGDGCLKLCLRGKQRSFGLHRKRRSAVCTESAALSVCAEWWHGNRCDDVNANPESPYVRARVALACLGRERSRGTVVPLATGSEKWWPTNGCHARRLQNCVCARGLRGGVMGVGASPYEAFERQRPFCAVPRSSDRAVLA